MTIIENHFKEILYSSSNFPMQISTVHAKNIKNMTLHWHKDLQITACLEGEMQFSIEGTPITLQAGELVFINRNILHQLIGTSQNACYIELDFDESLIDFHSNSLLSTNYVKPYTHSATTAGFLFNHHSIWEQELIQHLKTIYSLKDNLQQICTEYEIAVHIVQIWLLICKNIKKSMIIISDVSKSKRYLDSIQAMLAYIYEYYHQHIKLADIANSGHVSQTECSRIFKHFTQQSPYRFLLDYRLKMSTNYLINHPEMSITDVSHAIGFDHTSNYIHKFTEKYGTTPHKYKTSKNGKQG